MSWFSDATDTVTNAVEGAVHGAVNAGFTQPLSILGQGVAGGITPFVQNGSLGTLAQVGASVAGGGLPNLIPGGSGSGGGYDFVSGLLASLNGGRQGSAPVVVSAPAPSANPGAYTAPTSKAWIWIAAGVGVVVLVLGFLLLRKGRR